MKELEQRLANITRGFNNAVEQYRLRATALAKVTAERDSLLAQIEHQRVGSREVMEAMQKQDRRIAALQRENALLRGGIAVGSPREYWPDPA